MNIKKRQKRKAKMSIHQIRALKSREFNWVSGKEATDYLQKKHACGYRKICEYSCKHISPAYRLKRARRCYDVTLPFKRMSPLQVLRSDN